jgi:SOS response regulatory protein OraA/RecX
MKHLKSFILFESNYTPEEFVDELRRQLGKLNMSAVEVRELINRLDIESEIEMGKNPVQYSQELIKELGLDSRGIEGYMSHRVNRPLYSELKYL